MVDQLKIALCGGLSGLIGKTIVAPLDRIHIMAQTNPSDKFNIFSMHTKMHNIYKYQGFSKLWKGHSMIIIRTIPYSSIMYSSRYQYNKMLYGNGEIIYDYRSFISGSMCGLTSTSLTYPLDVIRTRLAVSTANTSIAQCTNGNLFKGFGITMLGSFCYTGIGFMFYDNLRNYVNKTNALHNFLCGTTGGLLAQIITFPIDVVRKLKQIDPVKTSSSKIIKNIFHTVGVRGFYRGLSINFLRNPISVGVSLALYEKLLLTVKH